MPKIARRAIVAALAMALAVSLALPASAAQLITYRGQTTQDMRMRLDVVKRDSGARSLRLFSFIFTLTCEDASTETVGITFGRRIRLSEAGDFQFDDTSPGAIFAYAIHLTGTVRFRSAEGTFEFTTSGLTEDEQAQLCTTGVLDWSAERRKSRPAGAVAASVPQGVAWFEVDRHGELVKVLAR